MQYALLIHGPFNDNWLEKIQKQINKFQHKFRQIILVSYFDDLNLYKEKIEKLKLNNIKIVTVKDLINPSFFNINRQILCVNSGLKEINDDFYVFKLRVDQAVDFNKVVKFIDENKIITTNCYSRIDRPYHPSDMFLAGKASLLKEYYSLPFENKTHLMIELENVDLCKKNPELTYVPIAPESMLCRNFLQKKGWEIKNSKMDSLNALKKYFIILNSWNIDFRSKKIRATKFWKNSLILPHYFRALPFENGPIENARCFMQHDLIGENPTLKDLAFLVLSKFIWLFWKNNLANPLNKIGFNDKNRNRKRRREILKILPYFLVHKEIKRLNEKIKIGS